MDRLQSSLNEFSDTLEKSKLKLSGRLGIPLGGQQLVEVPNRNSFVYVRLRNNQNEIIQAFNNQVSPAYDLPVLVRREGIFYVIDSVDVGMYASNWPNYSPYLPRHGSTHSFTDDGSGGGDMVWVYGRQFMPMLIIPSGSSGAPDVFLSPFLLRNLTGQWKYIGNTGTPNLTIYNPTGSFGVMVLVYVDISTGNPGYIVNSGSYFAATKTGTADITPFLPTLPNNPNFVPVSAIRLVSGTFVIGWDNIYDARQYFDIIPTGTTSGGGGGGGGGGVDQIGVFGESAGIPLGTGTIFNVNGSRLVFTLSGTTLNLSNSPDPQEFIGVMGQSQGIPLGTGSTLNVNGSRLILTISGTTLMLSNSPDPQEFIGIFAQDEGVPLGTGTVMNFVGPAVTATISGSVINVSVIPSGTVQVLNTGTLLGNADKFNFQYPLAVGLTGSMAYPYLQGSLLAWEDVSAQVTGTNAHFTITGTISLGTDRLYYNGLRQQRLTHYTVDANGKGFQTLFTGTFGDVMIMEYGNVGAQPLFIITGSVTQVGSGGAPTGAFYLLGKSENSLPSGIVITSLSSSPDIDGRGGAGVAYEFDQTGTAGSFTWSTAPAVVNSHVDYMSYLHVIYSGTSPVVTRGSVNDTITGAFDIRTKLSFGFNGSGSYGNGMYFVLSNSGNNYSAWFLIAPATVSTYQERQILAYIGTGTWANDGSQYSQNFITGLTWNIGTPTGPIYLRITKEVPNWIKLYYSTDGLTWIQVGERRMAGFSVGLIQYMLSNNIAGSSCELLVDWLRSNA